MKYAYQALFFQFTGLRIKEKSDYFLLFKLKFLFVCVFAWYSGTQRQFSEQYLFGRRFEI